MKCLTYYTNHCNDRLPLRGASRNCDVTERIVGDIFLIIYKGNLS